VIPTNFNFSDGLPNSPIKANALLVSKTCMYVIPSSNFPGISQTITTAPSSIAFEYNHARLKQNHEKNIIYFNFS
jgi:hypothetical protein